MPKPTNLPRWANVGGAIVEPSSGKKDIGWVVEAPSHTFFNWLQNLTWQWLVYLDGLTGEALTWTAFQIFNAGLRARNVGGGYAIDSGPGLFNGDPGFIGNAVTAVAADAGAAVEGTPANAANSVGFKSTATNNAAFAGDLAHSGATGTALRLTSTSTGRALLTNGPAEIANGPLLVRNNTLPAIQYPTARTEWVHVPVSTLVPSPIASGLFSKVTSPPNTEPPVWSASTGGVYQLLGGAFRLPAGADVDRVEFHLFCNDTASRSLTWRLIRTAYGASADSDTFVNPGGASGDSVLVSNIATAGWYSTSVSFQVPRTNNAVPEYGGQFSFLLSLPTVVNLNSFQLKGIRLRYQLTDWQRPI